MRTRPTRPTRRAPIAVLGTLIASALCAVPGVAGAADSATHLTGHVTDTDSRPIPGAYVTVLHREGSDWHGIAEATTGDDGGYTVDATSSTPLTVAFSANRTEHVWWDDSLTQDGATSISPEPGGSVDGIDAVLGVPASITGHVRGADGASVINTDVTLYRLVDGRWERSGVDSTTGRGSYAFPAVLPGTYRLEFAAEDSRFLTSYDGGATTLADATDVGVERHQAVTGIDASLTAAGRLAGQVRGPGGGGLGADVALYRLDDGVWHPTDRESGTDADGSYTIGKLAPGTYRLHFDGGYYYRDQWWRDAPDLAHATDVVVATGQVVSGVDARLVAAAVFCVKRPTITGTARPGHSLTATPGTWNPRSVTVGYRWFQRGHPVKGATGRTLRVTKALRGGSVTVVVTATARGLRPGHADSVPSARIR